MGQNGYLSFLEYIGAPELGWTLLVVAAAADFLLPFLLGLFVKNYSHRYMVMSLLGDAVSPVRGIYNRWLVLCGILFLCGSVQISAVYLQPLAAVITVCLWIYGLGGCIIAGLFPADVDEDPVTVKGTIHKGGAAAGFTVLVAVPLLIALLFIQSGCPGRGSVCTGCFAGAAASFVLFVLGDKPRFADTLVSWEGLWQRLSMLLAYIPIVLLAIFHLE